MAIEQYTGVTKVASNYYTVTSVVLLDETNSFTVGDMEDCVFVASSGGVLKFLEGTSTFTNCTFLELPDAWNAGAGQYYSSAPNNPRFLSPCGFIFKGCSWVITQNNCAFETATSGDHTFIVDDYGEPCRVAQTDPSNNAGGVIQVQSSDAAYTTTINGLIFDVPGSITLEQSTDTVSGIRVKDNNPTSIYNNVAFQIQTWDPDYASSLLPYGARQRFYNIEARSVATSLASTANRASERAVILVDPVGRILKTTRTDASNDYWRGILEVWRTFSGSFVDIATKQSISTVRTVITRSSNSELQTDETGSSFSVELKQYEQGLGSNTVVEDGDYTANFLAYGYQPQTLTVTIEDATASDAYDQGSLLLFADSNISVANSTTVNAYDNLNTAGKIYDRIKLYETGVATADFGTTYISTADGTTIDFSNTDVYFGDYSDNIVTYFDLDYTTPEGSAVGSVSFSGYTTDAPTAVSSDTTFAVTRSDLTGVGTTGSIIAKDIDINSDGTKLLLALNTTSTGGVYIVEYTLSTAYDLTTATQTNIARVYTTSNQYFGVSITNGKFVFIYNNSSGAWASAEFATAFDTTSAVTSNSGTGMAANYDSYSGQWSYDGTYFYMFRNLSNTFAYRYYQCSTPFDITTKGSQGYESMSSTELSTEHTTTAGGNLYQRWHGISMKWLDDNTVYLAGGDSGKYTIVTTATANKLIPSDLTGATYHDIPNVGGEIGWSTLSGQNLVSFMPGVTTATTLNYSLDNCLVGGTYDLVGAPNSLFLQANGSITASGDWDLLKTTGRFYEQDNATIGMNILDSRGAVASLNVTNIVSGSRIQMFNVTSNTELANANTSGTSYSYNYYSGSANAAVSTSDIIRIRLTYQSGVTAYLPFESTMIAGSTGASMYADQKQNPIYENNNIDGSTITEFTWDNPNLEIDVSDADGKTTVQRMYAWYQYFLTSEVGISDGFNGFVAEDSLNYVVQTAVLDMNIQNTSNNAVTITGGRFYRDDAEPIFIAGSGPIQMEYGRAYAVDTAASRAAEYGGAVYVNSTTGTSGTLYPQGQVTTPVDNIGDAITIANTLGIRKIMIERGSYTLTDEVLDRFSVVGLAPMAVTLTFTNTGESCIDTVFEEINITGTMTGQDNRIERGRMTDVSNFTGVAVRTGFSGTIGVASGQSATFVDCYSTMAGTSAPTLDMNTSGVVEVSIRRYSGGLLITNCTDANDVATVEYVSGKCEIQNTCTAGLLSIRGVAKLTDNSNGTVVDKTALVEDLIDVSGITINANNISIDNDAIAVATRTEMDANSSKLAGIDTTVNSISSNTVAIKTTVDAIPTTTYTVPTAAQIRAEIDSNSTALSSISANVVSIFTDTQALLSDVASIPTNTYNVPTANQIATAVQTAVLDETDGQTVIQAIVDAIDNENIDTIALVAAVRADLERSGGKLAEIKSQVDKEVTKSLFLGLSD